MDHARILEAKREALEHVAAYPQWQRNELEYLEERLAERESFWRQLRPKMEEQHFDAPHDTVHR